MPLKAKAHPYNFAFAGARGCAGPVAHRGITMFKLFGGSKSDHPMADLKEARRLLDELPAGDAWKATDELIHWHDSVRDAPDFKPEHRAQLVLMKIGRAHV